MSDDAQTPGRELPVPRLTDDYLESMIVHEDYHQFPQTRLTVCCLVLRNGWELSGEAACANPQQFDPQIGRRQARKNALKRVKSREQYLLRQRLFEAGILHGGTNNDV